jgi:hypothetical protein
MVTHLFLLPQAVMNSSASSNMIGRRCSSSKAGTTRDSNREGASSSDGKGFSTPALDLLPPFDADLGKYKDYSAIIIQPFIILKQEIKAI